MGTVATAGELERDRSSSVAEQGAAAQRECVPAGHTLPSALPSQQAHGRRAVVVHSGARDSYQVARALAESGQLEQLVTDLYWSGDATNLRARLLRLLPTSLLQQLAARTDAALPSGRVRALTLRGLATLGLDKLRHAPFGWKRALMRGTDAALGATAGREAQRTGATLVSYSYYGYHAFRASRAPGILFQLHPHPASVRRILAAERETHPECAASLEKEWELALPERDFERLVAEPRMAAHVLVASSFTRQTLIEHGIAPKSVTVIPYGVDCRRFSPAPDEDASRRGSREPGLQLLFVGRINQRKGLHYLLEAMRLLDRRHIHLTVCGRVVDGLDLFRPYRELLRSQIEIRPSVSAAELVEAYRAADLFVLPSIAEGFGQVLLESLACGLPVLSTTHTAAPDLIEEGLQGWVVEPGRADLLAERISWAADHPEALAAMRAPARARAEQMSWARFRAGVRAAFNTFVEQQSEQRRPGSVAVAGASTLLRPGHCDLSSTDLRGNGLPENKAQAAQLARNGGRHV